MEEYTAEVDQCCDIVELEEQMVARCLGGLRSEIGNVVCKLALKVERQLEEGRKSTYQPFNQGGITNWGSSSIAKTTLYPRMQLPN